jgi:uncharacterized membrane protein
MYNVVLYGLFFLFMFITYLIIHLTHPYTVDDFYEKYGYALIFFVRVTVSYTVALIITLVLFHIYIKKKKTQ